MQEETTASPSSSHSLMVETTTTKRQRLHPPPVTHIPLDLVALILCRLPVKSLLQLRCVCNSWNNLISNDRSFATKYLRLSNKHKHLITSSWNQLEKLNVISYPLNSLQLDCIFTTNATQLEYSSINPKSFNNFIATCDGLLCFAINQHLAILWNPSIRKFKELPSLEIPQENGFTRYAFGYDPFIHNYKVVVAFCYRRHSHVWHTQVQVHTLGTEFWTRINDFLSITTYELHRTIQHGMFVGGTVNWLTCRTFNEIYGLPLIVSLHLGKESYQEIPQPDYGEVISITLGVMRDCLCIVSYSVVTFYVVWLMTEYGNKESWIKLIHLPNIGSVFIFTRILYIYEDNNHALLAFKEKDKLKWVVNDSKNDTKKSFKIQDLSFVESNVYVESLISP